MTARALHDSLPQLGWYDQLLADDAMNEGMDAPSGSSAKQILARSFDQMMVETAREEGRLLSSYYIEGTMAWRSAKIAEAEAAGVKIDFPPYEDLFLKACRRANSIERLTEEAA